MTILRTRRAAFGPIPLTGRNAALWVLTVIVLAGAARLAFGESIMVTLLAGLFGSTVGWVGRSLWRRRHH